MCTCTETSCGDTWPSCLQVVPHRTLLASLNDSSYIGCMGPCKSAWVPQGVIAAPLTQGYHLRELHG